MSHNDSAVRREQMAEQQLALRGIVSPLVLDAMRQVPREAFLPGHLWEFAYEDSPLPIDAGQTISQPYIVALMTQALQLKGGETVLEVGTGSGYAAAILSRIAGRVYTVERLATLADKARTALADGGYDNVEVRTGDGTLGWPERAPYDAIIVAAGGPAVPPALKTQLKVGGRLVIPVGSDRSLQELVRITRVSRDEYVSEDLADVHFVPLVGAQGWEPQDEQRPTLQPALRAPRTPERRLAASIAAGCEPFDAIDETDLAPMLRRIGDARVVLIGEATHGTSEFYRLRERITRALIEQQGYSFVAIEGDWPDAARINHYVSHAHYPPSEWTAFARFPAWMWRNREVRAFVDWLRAHNVALEPGRRVPFYGLDLYSLYTSIRAVVEYLERVDPDVARIARTRYGCLTPWQTDPAVYGQAALTERFRSCEPQVVAMLTELLGNRQHYERHDGDQFLDAVQNARVVAHAENYYRVMYYGSRASWNLRDTHMFDTLQALLDHHGAGAKGIVWAHNSHVGDATATEMAARGEFNLGSLCRKAHGEQLYTIGFGTHSGHVAAASDWEGDVEFKSIRPALADSYEGICHRSAVPRFLLPLRAAAGGDYRAGLLQARLQRAIGVVYRPDTELESHYFRAVLPRQFDEYVWFDHTTPVTPLRVTDVAGMPATYPFGV